MHGMPPAFPIPGRPRVQGLGLRQENDGLGAVGANSDRQPLLFRIDPSGIAREPIDRRRIGEIVENLHVARGVVNFKGSAIDYYRRVAVICQGDVDRVAALGRHRGQAHRGTTGTEALLVVFPERDDAEDRGQDRDQKRKLELSEEPAKPAPESPELLPCSCSQARLSVPLPTLLLWHRPRSIPRRRGGCERRTGQSDNRRLPQYKENPYFRWGIREAFTSSHPRPRRCRFSSKASSPTPTARRLRGPRPWSRRPDAS